MQDDSPSLTVRGLYAGRFAVLNYAKFNALGLESISSPNYIWGFYGQAKTL